MIRSVSLLTGKLLFSIFLYFSLSNGFSQVNADSYILIDGSGEAIAKKTENKQRPVASLTKVATALVVLAELEKNSELDPQTTLITVPPGALVGGANPLSLAAGDKLSVIDALHAAILGSDNVSAYSLAEHFGGVSAFVEKMNALADSLMMVSTKFINPHGLDYPDKQGHSTALDMAVLGLAATENTTFMEICGKKKSAVTVNRRGSKITKTVSNTNHMLGEQGCDGMKTGTTRRSGACFIGTAKKNGRRLVAVVLDSPDRFADTKALFDQVSD
ncbi:MAG: serine hydrolase [Verrucomicrobiales bacterium]|nr:serine hydrolase [Verrucomicrobiales bacterium]